MTRDCCVEVELASCTSAGLSSAISKKLEGDSPTCFHACDDARSFCIFLTDAGAAARTTLGDGQSDGALCQARAGGGKAGQGSTGSNQAVRHSQIACMEPQIEMPAVAGLYTGGRVDTANFSKERSRCTAPAAWTAPLHHYASQVLLGIRTLCEVITLTGGRWSPVYLCTVRLCETKSSQAAGFCTGRERYGACTMCLLRCPLSRSAQHLTAG